MNWRLLARTGITVAIVTLLDLWFANAQTPEPRSRVGRDDMALVIVHPQVECREDTHAMRRAPFRRVAARVRTPQRNSQ